VSTSLRSLRNTLLKYGQRMGGSVFGNIVDRSSQAFEIALACEKAGPRTASSLSL